MIGTYTCTTTLGDISGDFLFFMSTCNTLKFRFLTFLYFFQLFWNWGIDRSFMNLAPFLGRHEYRL